MSLDRSLIKIILSHLDENGRSALENKLIPRREDFQKAVETTTLDVLPGQPLGLTRTKSKNDLREELKSIDDNNAFCLLENGDILQSCITDPLAERDMQAIKALLRALKKDSQLCDHLMQYHHHPAEETKNSNDTNQSVTHTEEQRKHTVINALDHAGILPVIQYIICDSLLTGGRGCARTGGKPADLIQDLAPLIVATGCTWDDFFKLKSPMTVLPQSLIVMASALDCPEILMAILGIKHFTHDTVNLYYDDQEVSLYNQVVAAGKITIASRIADDLAHEKSHQKSLSPQNAEASIGYHRLHLHALKTREPLNNDTILQLFTAIGQIMLAAKNYLKKYPKSQYRHTHQPDARQIIDASRDCMKQINNKSNNACVTASITFLNTINQIYTTLSEGYLKYSLGSSEIVAPLGEVAKQLKAKGHLDKVAPTCKDTIEQFVKRAMIDAVIQAPEMPTSSLR
jgi:hypothetical protein